MSTFEKRDNSGSLFKVEEKRSENSADYSGTCMIDGVEFYMDSWLRTATSGKRWMSFSFKAKNQQQAAPLPRHAPAKKQVQGFDMDSDIPF